MPHPPRPRPDGPHSEQGQPQPRVTALGDTGHSDGWECPQTGPSQGSSRPPLGPTRPPPSPFPASGTNGNKRRLKQHLGPTEGRR